MDLNKLSRREFLEASLAATALSAPLAWANDKTPALRIAPFRFDVTPPVGHPLCGWWITPMVDCADELEAIGFVLLGAGQPIVICAVDWTGILNQAYIAWRTALAEAAASVYGLLKRTEEAGCREILTIAAQDEFVSPTRRFDVEEV